MQLGCGGRNDVLTVEGTGGTLPLSGPTRPITIWYGEQQSFGSPESPGGAQDVVNVLGTVSHGPASYRVNGGPPQALALGPDGFRLAGRGDFNLELRRDALFAAPRENLVEFAVDGEDGEAISAPVRFVVYDEPTRFTSTELDFADFVSPVHASRQVSIVDGLWERTDEGLRVVEPGYDRLIAVGDRTWEGDVEVSADVRIHSWELHGGVGLAVGWQGHAGNEEPRLDWPVEALGWLRNGEDSAQLELVVFDNEVLGSEPTRAALGTTLTFKVRSQHTGFGQTLVSFKVWPAASPEPSEFQLEESVPARGGSVLLVAHFADVTWQSVTMTSLDPTRGRGGRWR